MKGMGLVPFLILLVIGSIVVIALSYFVDPVIEGIQQFTLPKPPSNNSEKSNTTVRIIERDDNEPINEVIDKMDQEIPSLSEGIQGFYPQIILFLQKHLGVFWFLGFIIICACLLFILLYIVSWLAEMLDVGAKVMVMIAFAIFMFLVLIYLLANWGIITNPFETVESAVETTRSVINV